MVSTEVSVAVTGQHEESGGDGNALWFHGIRVDILIIL